MTEQPAAASKVERIADSQMITSRVTQELGLLFQDVFEDHDLIVGRDTTADDVEGWDSARMVELIMAAETHFGVTFTTREIDALGSVGDFIDLISRKLGSRSDS